MMFFQFFSTLLLRCFHFSPNRSRLKSVADVIAYLVAPATCKCGLVCPFKLEEMFNFNPNVISRPLLQKPAQSIGACDSCKVNAGFEAILPQFSPEKIMRMLRKGSKKKKKKSKNSEKEGRKKNRQNKTGMLPFFCSFFWEKPFSIFCSFVIDSYSSKWRFA